MNWKEPHPVRQQHIKQFLNFQHENLRKLFWLVLSGPLLTMMLTIVSHNRQGWHFYFYSSLFCSGVVLLFKFGSILLINSFEATYFLDRKGVRIRRAAFGRILLWRYVTSLEVVPHPTIENIALFKFVSRVMNKEWIEEIPFEIGQIDTAEVVEFYKKCAAKPCVMIT